MNEFEKVVLKKLKQSEDDGNDDIIFPNLGYVVERAYEEGKLSVEWRKEYEQYCSENLPGTDDFSYLDLMDRIYEKFK